MPLSPLIFNLVIEHLAGWFHSDPLISGRTVENSEHRIGLFVDDVILMITDPIDNLPRILNILADFEVVLLPSQGPKIPKSHIHKFNIPMAGLGIAYLCITLSKSARSPSSFQNAVTT